MMAPKLWSTGNLENVKSLAGMGLMTPFPAETMALWDAVSTFYHCLTQVIEFPFLNLLLLRLEHSPSLRPISTMCNLFGQERHAQNKIHMMQSVKNTRNFS